MSIKIASAVILYNPNEKLYQNISSYIDEIDILFLIDNSDEKAKMVSVVENEWGKKIRYVCLDGNKGVAYALNVALQMANGYDYLMTMDQDTSFLKGMMRKYKAKICEYAKNDQKIVSFGCEWEGNSKENIKYPTKLITSANVVNIKVANKIGGFLNELFIDEVDHEFCFRLLNSGYKIIQFSDIMINHELGHPVVKKMFNMNFNLYSHSPLRRYYMIRNRLYVIRKFPRYTLMNFDHYFSGVIRASIKILLFEKQKKRFLRAVIYAVKDFLGGNMGECTFKV